VAQDPKPGKKVAQNTKVRINVSSGPAQVTVPPVVGLPFAQASSELKAQDFQVEQVPTDSNEAAGTVLSQDPRANTQAPKGSKVTLEVSKGPTTTQVPDVTSLDRDTAKATLESSGFKVKVVEQDVTDPSQENIVLDQSPSSTSRAKPGTTVTIFVGRAKASSGATGPTGPTGP
jgi:serine/threonine-protein kinase